MIIMMRKFMLDECVGGRRGRLLIDIFDHIQCTYTLHYLQCRCHIHGSFATLSSLPPWWSVSAQGLQLPYAMYVASKLGHLLLFPIAFPLSASFRLSWRKLGVQYSCFGTRVSGMCLTCPAQLSCDLIMCASLTNSASYRANNCIVLFNGKK